MLVIRHIDTNIMRKRMLSHTDGVCEYVLAEIQYFQRESPCHIPHFATFYVCFRVSACNVGVMTYNSSNIYLNRHSKCATGKQCFNQKNITANRTFHRICISLWIRQRDWILEHVLTTDVIAISNQISAIFDRKFNFHTRPNQFRWLLSLSLYR